MVPFRERVAPFEIESATQLATRCQTTNNCFIVLCKFVVKFVSYIDIQDAGFDLKISSLICFNSWGIGNS